MPSKTISKSQLISLYTNRKLTSRQVASELGVCKTTILNHLRKHKIQVHPGHVLPKPLPEWAQQAKHLYINKHMSQPTISKYLGARQIDVSMVLRKMKVKMRKPHESVKLMNNGHGPRHYDLTPPQQQEIAELYLSGMSSRRISRHLHITTHKVSNHLRSMKLLKPPQKNIDWLIDFQQHPKDNDRERGERLGVHRSAVVYQRKRLGVPSQRTKKPMHGLQTLSTAQRRKCYERDKYTCQCCDKRVSKRRRDKAAHHIVFRAYWKECQVSTYSLHDLCNLITLCKQCHRELHNQFRSLERSKIIQESLFLSFTTALISKRAGHL